MGRTLLPIDTPDETLVAAWKTETSTVQLAEQFNTTGSTLQSHWRRLQKEGKLPMESRAVNAHTRAFGLADRGNDIDGRPSLLYHDPLLEKLYEVHDRPRYDFFHHPPKQDAESRRCSRPEQSGQRVGAG